MPAERVVMRGGARSFAFDVCGDFQARDRAAYRPGAIDGAGDDRAFPVAGLDLAAARDVTDSELEARLYKNAGTKQGHRRQCRAGLGGAPPRAQAQARHAVDPVGRVHRAHPDGYRYSRFCELYRAWEGKLSVTMRQAHAGGDKLFVDYAGDTAPVVIDRLTGEIREAQIFVAVLGASNFTYAEATWTQGLADWIGAHTRAFEAIGGVPGCSCPTTPRPRSSRRACTSRRSTGPIPRWRRITAPPCCRPGRAGRATRRRSKPAC